MESYIIRKIRGLINLLIERLFLFLVTDLVDDGVLVGIMSLFGVLSFISDVVIKNQMLISYCNNYLLNNIFIV